MHRLVARRTLLARSAAALAVVPVMARGALAAAAKPHRPKPPTQKAFRLVTGCAAAGGCACHACQQHAANKLFAARADVVRAHPGCNCQVTTQPLPRDIWIALFGLAAQPTTPAVDRRDPRVGQILAGLPHHHR
jgi:hypothetical protein